MASPTKVSKDMVKQESLSLLFLLYMDQIEQMLFARAHSLFALVWGSDYLCLIHSLYQSIFQHII